MIPKILHRVWIGTNPIDDHYLPSWQANCPGWKIKTWTTADAERITIPYVQEALCAKKWAFVSDYLRLYALQREGGIYLDTDVELTGSFDSLLSDRFFIGLTARGFPQTAVIGAVPNDRLIGELIDTYNQSKFDLGYGVYDEHPVNLRFMSCLRQHGTDFTGIDIESLHEPEPGVRLYPCSLLCARAEGRANIAIHHANGTWLDPYKRMNVIPIGCGLRLLRLKRRKFANSASQLNLMPDERLLAHIRYRRMYFALVTTRHTQPQ